MLFNQLKRRNLEAVWKRIVIKGSGSHVAMPSLQLILGFRDPHAREKAPGVTGSGKHTQTSPAGQGVLGIEVVKL
jgi:hypothetical protein